jgi:hypothetical protein
LIWPEQDRFVAIAKMAELGRIAATRLRGTFRRTVAGTGFRKVSTTVMAMPATRVSGPCADDLAFPPPHLLPFDATIDLVDD